MGHQVTAPYVTLRVPNELGQEVTLGFYAGAVLPARANSDDLERLTRKGMVAEVEEPAPEPVAKPESEPEAELVAETSSPRPAQNASKADWVAYAESQGFSSDEAEAMSKADLIATLGG